VNLTLTEPRVMTFDAAEQIEAFDPSIRKYLAGVSILAIPLMPAPGELIGLIVLYRKGEQPFTDEDVALAELIGHSTALAVERND
jgi:GAF domain-containing protein